MELAQSILFIAGGLMLGLGAVGAAVGVGVLVASSWKALRASLNCYRCCVRSYSSYWVWLTRCR